MGSPHIAGISRVDEVLGDPPWLITKAAIEICNPRPRVLQPIMVHVDRRNILPQPGQKLRVNPRADILPGWIFSGRGEFFVEFGRAAWIKFEKQTFRIFQCHLIWSGEWIIVPTERMNRADEIKWRLRVGDTPNATFRQRVCSAGRVCEQGNGTKQEESNRNAVLSANGQEHFRFLAEKTARSNNSFFGPRRHYVGHRYLRPARFFMRY